MDKTVAGAAAGIVSGLITGLISSALYNVNICSLCLIAIGGGMFNRAMAPPGFSVTYLPGWAAHLTVSMILGVILIYFLFYTGRDYGLLKGAFFGLAVWFVTIVVISPLAGYIPSPVDAAGVLIVLGYHLLFGVVAAALILRYSKLEATKPR